jgi:toxin-antitoxin system PIN domain toxin
VILIDVNLLLYATVATAPEHAVARPWFNSCLNGTSAVGLPWVSLLGFVRIVSNRRVYSEPVPVAEAWREVERWLDCPTVWIPQPTDRHREILRPLLVEAALRANLVSDAHLAALAIEHGLTLCSTDGDFSRFKNLRWENPLRAATG